jgi:hypothetical protein
MYRHRVGRGRMTLVLTDNSETITWINRREYVYPYALPRYSAGERLHEQQVLHERTRA